MRLRVVLLLIGAAMVALTFTFPLWQPLLDRPVVGSATSNTGLATDLQTVLQAFPPDQQAAYQAIIAANPQNGAAMLEAAIADPIPAPEDMASIPSMNGPSVAATGSFVRVDPIRWGQGEVTLYQQANEEKVLRFENFSVANGPSLRVILSASEEPTTVDAMRQGGIEVDLGQVLGTRGAQNYAVAAEIDLSQYGSIVIYSPTLNLIYTYASLTMRL